MVNFSNDNLAKRNEQSRKLKNENNKVLNDLKLTGLAKMFVAESLKVIFESVWSDSVDFNKIKNYQMFEFEAGQPRNNFESKVREEFKLLGYDGKVEHPEGFVARIVATPLE